MSTGRSGPPKHQNVTTWKPNKGVQKKEKELGGKQHPFPAITGVCSRCKEKIEWRRKYGKYKPLTEPAKCHQCGKRSVRQAYHALCTGCAKEKNVCAKCCHPAAAIIGRDAEDEEKERKQLEEALGTLRERDKRSLLRAMEKGPVKNSSSSKPHGSKQSMVHNEDDDNDEEEKDEDDSCCSESEDSQTSD